MTITPGARRLWAEHEQDPAVLERLCTGAHVTRDDVENLLRERGLLPPLNKAAASSCKSERKPRSKPAAAQAPMAPLAPAPKPTLTDPLFLDGNTITVTWKKGRKLKGTVQFRADASRPHIHKKQKSSTRYRIFFEGRSAGGARVSWNRLKARKFEVTASPRPVVKGRAWTAEEERALRRRHKVKESYVSMTCSLGRTQRSITGRIQMLTNKNVASKGHGKFGVRTDRSIKWRDEVREALQRLGGQGTQAAICADIEKHVELTEHHRTKSPGMSTLRFHQNVAAALCRQSSPFEPTGVKAVTPGATHAKMVYRLKEPAVEQPPEDAEEAEEPLISPHVKFHNRNVGGPKKSARKQAETLAGGDRRHGD